MLDLSKAVIAAQLRPIYGAPCEITQVSPLLVTLAGETGVEGEKVTGLTYALGDAFAIFTSPGVPIIFPIT